MIVAVNVVIPAMVIQKQVVNHDHLVKPKHQNQVVQQKHLNQAVLQKPLNHNPLEQLVTNQLPNHNQLELQHLKPSLRIHLPQHQKDQNQVSSAFYSVHQFSFCLSVIGKGPNDRSSECSDSSDDDSKSSGKPRPSGQTKAPKPSGATKAPKPSSATKATKPQSTGTASHKPATKPQSNGTATPKPTSKYPAPTASKGPKPSRFRI